MLTSRPSLPGTIARGIASGVAGTVVMTAFQEAVEMPITRRAPSYAPANFAQKVLPVHPDNQAERTMLNWETHFGLGAMWGSAYGVAAHAGLRGARAITTVFGVVYVGDVLLNTALGLYKPRTWSRQEWTVDVVDKFVQAAATGILYDQVFGRRRSRRKARQQAAHQAVRQGKTPARSSSLAVGYAERLNHR